MASKSASPRAAHSPSPSRKLNKEELEQVSQRLFYQQQERAKQNEEKRKAKLEAVGLPKRPLTTEAQEGLVQRIYVAQMDKKRRQQENDEKQRESLMPATKKISETELQESVQRMYYHQKERSQKEREKAAEKYGMKVDHKRLDKDQQQQMADRLAKNTKEEAKQKLFEKYIAPMDPKKVTISKDQLKAMADRLCTKKG